MLLSCSYIKQDISILIISLPMMLILVNSGFRCFIHNAEIIPRAPTNHGRGFFSARDARPLARGQSEASVLSWRSYRSTVRGLPPSVLAGIKICLIYLVVTELVLPDIKHVMMKGASLLLCTSSLVVLI